MAGRHCEGMESHDLLTESEVKIEIDVAEDESLFWNTEDDTPGKVVVRMNSNPILILLYSLYYYFFRTLFW